MGGIITQSKKGCRSKNGDKMGKTER